METFRFRLPNIHTSSKLEKSLKQSSVKDTLHMIFSFPCNQSTDSYRLHMKQKKDSNDIQAMHGNLICYWRRTP